MRGIAIAFVLAIGSLAHAAPDTNNGAARAAYEQGMRSYNLAEYGKALDAFKEAYRVYPDASFLFNIGQCYRQLNDKPNAIRFYRTYLREAPNAPNRDEVTRLVSSLERALAEEQMAKPQPSAAPAVSAAAAPSPRPELIASAPVSRPQKKPLVNRGWFWGTIVGGVAAVGLAVGLGVGLTAQRDPTPSYGTIVKN